MITDDVLERTPSVSHRQAGYQAVRQCAAYDVGRITESLIVAQYESTTMIVDVSALHSAGRHQMSV